jgi:hypothetical protein
VKTSTNNVLMTCLISTLAITSHSVHALDAGTVVFKIGDPIVTNKQGSRDIIKGDDLGSGDTILTQSGIVQIRFADKSFMSLKPKTEFVIDTYNDTSSQQSKYKLNYGEIRTVSGLIGKTNQKDYSIETPVATIGIRGTKFRVAVLEIPSENGEPSFQMTLSMGEDGAVDIFLPSGETIPLDAGQISSLGGLDTLIEIIQTDTAIQETLQNAIDQLPVALEQLNLVETINQLILDIEEPPSSYDSEYSEEPPSSYDSEYSEESSPPPPNAM